MLGQSKSHQLLFVVHNSLDSDKATSVYVAETESVIIDFFCSSSNHSFKKILCELNFKKWLSVEIFNIVLFPFKFPEKNFSKTICCKVFVVWAHNAAKLWMSELDYTSATNIFSIIIAKNAEWHTFESRKISWNIHFICGHIIDS